MKIIKRGDQKGFILFITMIMLLIFAIVAIGMYQQTSVLTKNVQQDLFKKQAEAVSVAVLKQIEQKFPEKVSSSEASSGISITGGRDICNKADGESVRKLRCDPISSDDIDAQVQGLGSSEEGAASPTFTKWANSITVGANTKGYAVYTIQQLGADEDKKYFTFRTTVVSKVLTGYDAISSTFVVPIMD